MIGDGLFSTSIEDSGSNNLISKCFAQRKRAANIDDDLSSRSNQLPSSHSVISDDRITSSKNDSAGDQPTEPLHENSTFPTSGNISEEMANDLCRGTIKQTDVYDECLDKTATDTEYYVRGCVEDIKVSYLQI